MGMLEAFRYFADKYKIALVNSMGQLTEYAKKLSDLAQRSGGHVFVICDYDIAGLIIASKLGPNVPWLGVDKKMIEHFNIPLPSLPDPYGSAIKVYPEGELRRRVVPYDVKAKGKNKEKLRRLIELGENELKDEDGKKVIVKDTRFSLDRVDLDWLWVRDVRYTKDNGKKGIRVEGHKIEIDSVVEDQGAEAVWNYFLAQIIAYHPTCDCTRIIDRSVYSESPDPPYLYDNVSASSDIGIISDTIKPYLEGRASEITQDRRQEIEQELKNYNGRMDDIPKAEQGYRSSLVDTVHKDDIINDVVSVVRSVRQDIEEEEGLSDLEQQIDDIASKVGQGILDALKKLDAEKGYGILKKLGLEEDDGVGVGVGGGGSSNSSSGGDSSGGKERGR